jgi:hypothetical protein
VIPASESQDALPSPVPTVAAHTASNINTTCTLIHTQSPARKTHRRNRNVCVTNNFCYQQLPQRLPLTHPPLNTFCAQKHITTTSCLVYSHICRRWSTTQRPHTPTANPIPQQTTKHELRPACPECVSPANECIPNTHRIPCMTSSGGPRHRAGNKHRTSQRGESHRNCVTDGRQAASRIVSVRIGLR